MYHFKCFESETSCSEEIQNIFSLVSVSQLINWLVVSQSCISNGPLLQSMGVEMKKDLKQSCRPQHLLWWVLSESSSLVGSHCLFHVLHLCMISSARLPAYSRSGSLPVSLVTFSFFSLHNNDLFLSMNPAGQTHVTLNTPFVLPVFHWHTTSKSGSKWPPVQGQGAHLGVLVVLISVSFIQGQGSQKKSNSAAGDSKL